LCQPLLVARHANLPVNPFAKRDSHSAGSIVWYKVLTLATWLLSVVVTVYYAVESPPHDGKHDGKHYHHRGSIWHQNHDHYSGFTLNSVITSIYWCVFCPPSPTQRH
jgi:hypothetical protein